MCSSLISRHKIIQKMLLVHSKNDVALDKANKGDNIDMLLRGFGFAPISSCNPFIGYKLYEPQYRTGIYSYITLRMGNNCFYTDDMMGCNTY